MKQVFTAGFVLSILFFVAACHDDTAERVQKEVDLRIEKFRKEETATCLKGLYSVAGHKADSTLLEEARRMGIDTLTPLRRERPTIPTNNHNLDSIEVKPLF